jgi:hypothetical protein
MPLFEIAINIVGIVVILKYTSCKVSFQLFNTNPTTNTSISCSNIYTLKSINSFPFNLINVVFYYILLVYKQLRSLLGKSAKRGFTKLNIIVEYNNKEGPNIILIY